MDRRILQSLVRSVLLFLLSIVLVAGFYFHSAFYSVGLYPLLLIGGFVTFLVILGARLILLGELPRGRPAGELTFGLEEGDRVQRQIVSLVVLPVEGRDVPVVGQAVPGRDETGSEFGRLPGVRGTTSPPSAGSGPWGCGRDPLQLPHPPRDRRGRVVPHPRRPAHPAVLDEGDLRGPRPLLHHHGRLVRRHGGGVPPRLLGGGDPGGPRPRPPLDHDPRPEPHPWRGPPPAPALDLPPPRPRPVPRGPRARRGLGPDRRVCGEPFGRVPRPLYGNRPGPA